MATKREEERNEKIIRGLMKLPPNRRCLNCNSLGPQYVCTDFWTFVCTTCSGVHREFTHRVKSVSMAKFTSQEVNALQKGGNQRARELLLKGWDPLRRLPDNSNVEKIRQFIKNVYVEKKYSVEKSLDHSSTEGIRSPEDHSRRASSYHSYSQSPPYDFQYEERRYGKNAFGLSKKPGSDRSLYEGKLSGFLSPTHFSGQPNDDLFSNDGSFTRVSDYSFSGGSPCSEASRDIPSDAPQLPKGPQDADRSSRRNSGRIFHPQRASSCGGFASFDSSSVSFSSLNSLSLFEGGAAPEQCAEFSQDRSSSTSSQNCSFPGALDGSNSSGAPFATEEFSLIQFSAADINFSKPPLTGTVTSAQQCPASSVTTFTSHQASEIQQLSSLNLFPMELHQQPPAVSMSEASSIMMPNTHGWATFDLPENLMSMGKEKSSISEVPISGGNVLEITNPFSVEQSSSCHDSTKHDHSLSAYGFEHGDGHNVIANDITGLKNDNSNRSAVAGEPASSGIPSNLFMEISLPIASSLAGVHSLENNLWPTNPFDLPDESEVETRNMMWDVGSLQAALPNNQTPTSFVGGADHFWLSEGTLGYASGQAPIPQIPNIQLPVQVQPQSQPQGPVAAAASGNPFA